MNILYINNLKTKYISTTIDEVKRIIKYAKIHTYYVVDYSPGAFTGKVSDIVLCFRKGKLFLIEFPSGNTVCPQHEFTHFYKSYFFNLHAQFIAVEEYRAILKKIPKVFVVEKKS